MSKVMRVALPGGYNALTDTDPRHFSLFTDQDNVLIKEHSRGDGLAGNGGEVQVNHALGYTPHYFVYTETATAGRFKISNGYDILLPWQTWAEDNDLFIHNTSAGANKTAKFFIFYDNIG